MKKRGKNKIRNKKNKAITLYMIAIFLFSVFLITLINFNMTKFNITKQITSQVISPISLSSENYYPGEIIRGNLKLKLEKGDLIPNYTIIDVYISKPLCPEKYYCKDGTLDYCEFNESTGYCNFTSVNCEAEGYDKLEGTCEENGYECCEPGTGSGEYISQLDSTCSLRKECWTSCSNNFSFVKKNMIQFVSLSSTPNRGNYTKGNYTAVISGVRKYFGYGFGYAYCFEETSEIECTVDENCSEDKPFCLDGKCVECKTNSDCQEGYECADNQCKKIETEVCATWIPIDSCQNITEPGCYQLTKDINANIQGNCFNIQADEVVFDCQNHLIQNSGRDWRGNLIGSAFSISRKNYVKITNCRISEWIDGIRIYFSNYTTVFNNTFSENHDAIFSDFSNYGSFSLNIIDAQGGYGIALSYSNFDKLLGNEIRSGRYGIHLSYSQNITINNTISCNNNLYDIYSWHSSGSGKNNTCDRTDEWNDEGQEGCTYSCSGQQQSCNDFCISQNYGSGACTTPENCPYPQIAFPNFPTCWSQQPTCCCYPGTSGACTDSDGGINYYVAGTCIDSSGTYSDNCADNNYLIEQYCSNGHCQTQHNVYCEHGCSYGRCLAWETPLTGYAIGSEGGEVNCTDWNNEYSVNLEKFNLKAPEKEGWYWLIVKLSYKGEIFSAEYEPFYVPSNETNETNESEEHYECINESCILVEGPGNDECSSDEDCVIECIPNWQCSPWSDCENGIQRRTCTDINECGIEERKPKTTQECTIQEVPWYEKIPKWLLWFALGLVITAIAIIVILFVLKPKISEEEIPQAVIDYIKKAKAKGMSDIMIKRTLIEHGWDKNLVNAAMKVVEKEK